MGIWDLGHLIDTLNYLAITTPTNSCSAPLQTSLHTVQVFSLLCNVTMLIVSYKYISSHLSVSHFTHVKLVAYCRILITFSCIM